MSSLPATMAAFPTEIIADILSRLPVKHLFRLKCVCKSWNSLIKTSDFIKLHLKQTLITKSERYLLKSSLETSFYFAQLDLPHDRLSFSDLDHPIDYEAVQLFGSCNGVVCISDYFKIDVFLFNPLTKSRRQLPAKQIPNPEDDLVVFGFGYDSKSDDYKVLRVLQGYSCRKCCYDQAHVYSLNNNAWKSVKFISSPYYLPYAAAHGVLVDETLHFIVGSEELDSQQRKRIACFNLQTETVSLMDCPDHDDKSKTDWEFMEFHVRELGGCLAVTVVYLTRTYAARMLPYLDGNDVRNQKLIRADLWAMKEYGNRESWVKLFGVTNLPDVGRFNFVWPVVYSKDGRRILLDINCLEMGWYDLESNEFEKLTARGLPQTYYQTGYFSGSLVSLDYKPRPKSVKETTLPRKNKKNKKNKKNSEKFLATGFKLKL